MYKKIQAKSSQNNLTGKETFFIVMNLIAFSFLFPSKIAINEYFGAFLDKHLCVIKLQNFSKLFYSYN